MKDCKGIFGRLFGHKYQQIYNIEDREGFPKTLTKLHGATTEDIVLIKDRFHKKTYLHSICKRCGEIIVKVES